MSASGTAKAQMQGAATPAVSISTTITTAGIAPMIMKSRAIPTPLVITWQFTMLSATATFSVVDHN